MRKQKPQLYTPEDVERVSTVALSDGRWVPARAIARPRTIGFSPLKLAWMVFTGKADVLIWDGQ